MCSWCGLLSLFVVSVATTTLTAKSLLLKTPRKLGCRESWRTVQFVILSQQHSYTCVIPDIYLPLMCTLKSPVIKITFLGKLLLPLFWTYVGDFSVMYLLFLEKSLTRLNEMHEWISLHPICKVCFCFHYPSWLFTMWAEILGENLSHSILFQ